MPTTPKTKRRLLLVAISYAVALVACLPFPPRDEWIVVAAYLWAFPIGLWTFFGRNADVVELIIGYIVYIGLFAWAVLAGRRRIFVAVYVLIFAALALNVAGCRRVWNEGRSEIEKGKAGFAALDAVRDSAPFVSEFVRLFPGAQVNYRYFSSTGEPGFVVEVDLYERYEFTMRLPVRFDSERRKVIGYGEPKFYLLEAASQKGRETSYEGERRFGSAEWHALVEHDGDFAAIGYVMRTNQHVAGFKDRKIQP